VKKQELIAYVESIALPLTQQMHYELVDVDYVKEGPNWYLKVFADKEGGFSINDCVDLSHALEKELEKQDPIETAYILEVSSPGLDRPLKKDKDYARSIGKLVDVKLYQPSEAAGGQKSFQAKLLSYDPQTEAAELELEDGTSLQVMKKEMSSIRLAVVF
jgi:ribosome maturation factor RimP